MKNVLKPVLRAEAAVIVNSKSTFYHDFSKFIKPYLDNFGVPYVIWDIAMKKITPDIKGYGLIIIGHREIDGDMNTLSFRQQQYILAAIEKDTGLVNFDCDICTPDYAPRYQFVQDIFGFSYIQQHRVSSIEFADSSHYITEKHAQGEVINLDNTITPGTYMHITGIKSSCKHRVLVTCDDKPFITIGWHGTGRVVQWGGYDWISTRVHGPVWNMDDLVWRSFVWASRKPFIMQGMPPFAVFRVDDCAGCGTDKDKSASPFYWVKIANKYGFKPWLGLFIDDMSKEAVIELKSLIAEGKATAMPHAFNMENSIYFNSCFGPVPDEELERRMEHVKNWLRQHKISLLSKYFLAHYYEAGTNAYKYIDEMGYEFVGTMISVNEKLISNERWLMGGPYRIYDEPQRAFSGSWDRKRSHPFFYADYLEIPGHPEYTGKFFNVITEMRDDVGYEWFDKIELEKLERTGDARSIIQHGINQARRAFDSMVLMELFTHESSFLRYLRPSDWDQILAGVTSKIASYNPMYVTLDYACQYVRAKYNSKIKEAIWNPQRGILTVGVSGKTDIPTMIYLFNGDAESITYRLLDVPQFDKDITVEYESL